MIKPRNPPGQKSRAQAMVEFALALPVLLLVMYGLLEAGRLLFIYASVVTSARQAARYGSATGLTTANIHYYQDCGGIRAAAKRVAFINRIEDNNISITYDHGLDSSGQPRWWSQYSYNTSNPPQCWPTSWDNPNPIANGDRIRVQVVSHWDPIVRVVPSWRGFDIRSQSNRTLLVGAAIAIDATQAGYTGGGQLNLAKGASSETYDHVGEVITYTYTLINPGSNSIAGPFTITDDHMGGFSCAAGPIPGGNGTVSCTRTYVITQADITAGFVTNNATATTDNGGNPLSASASKTITLKPLPSLQLEKVGTAPDVIVNNAVIVYTYTLTNTGNVPLTAPFEISDNKVRQGQIDCSGVPSPLAPQASGTCTGTYSITNQDIGNGMVVNVATATAMYKSQVVTSNSATATVITPPLLLIMTASPTTVTTPGTVITFTYTLRNPGSNDLTSPYSITNTKTGIIPNNCNNLTSPLKPGASTSCTGTYTVTQADIDTGSIINSASATARQINKTVNSNTATVMVTALQTVKLTLTKKASVTTATTVGISINYTYTLQNTGNVTLGGPYAIQDDKITSVNCSGATGTMLPNASKTCSAVYVTAQPDLEEGSIVNTATATAKFAGQTVTSTAAQATVITYTGPRLRLQKSASPTTMSNVPGQIITYTYTLKNTGGVPLTSPYTVTDDKIPNVKCAGTGTLNAAQSTTCTATYTTTPDDVSRGGVTNNASATALNAGVPLTSNTATLTVPVYICSGDTLTFGPVPNADNVTWTLSNNSGIQLRISSISITWSNNTASSLTEVRLGGTTIWSGTDSSGAFTLPGQSWTLPPSGTDMQVIFSAAATEIRGTVTLSNPSCP